MQEIHDPCPEHNDLRTTLLTSSEGRLLIVGLSMAIVYFVWLGYELVFSPADFQGLIGMTATEIVFGRVACLAFGYSLEMGHGTVIFLCMVIETILVLVFYPLFALIWRQLLVVRWLKRLSDRTRKHAEQHKDLVERYGIVGLFLFVWVPFWMTGPVVGCMIGYLLGLRIWVNITTVLIGTYAAILGWAFFLRHMHEKFASYSSYAAMVLMGLLIAVFTGQMIKRISRKKKETV